MADYLTVAEVYRMQHRLIEMFGGLHGVRDKGAVEAAVFRPQTGYYNSIEEEAAALMESLSNNHGFLEFSIGSGRSSNPWISSVGVPHFSRSLQEVGLLVRTSHGL